VIKEEVNESQFEPVRNIIAENSESMYIDENDLKTTFIKTYHTNKTSTGALPFAYDSKADTYYKLPNNQGSVDTFGTSNQIT
jgi:hypothetical protein